MVVKQIGSLLAFATPNSNEILFMNINTGKTVKTRVVAKHRAK